MAQDLFRTERGDRLSWTAMYYMAFKATLDSHLRSFQFKIINIILITNRQLKLYQIKNSENCEFCRVETETFENLFFKCVFVKAILSKIQNWLCPKMIFMRCVSVNNISNFAHLS